MYDPNLSAGWTGATIHIAPGQAWTAQTGTVVSSWQGGLTYIFTARAVTRQYETPTSGNNCNAASGDAKRWLPAR